MKLPLLLRHLTNRSLIGEQPSELQSDVHGACSVAILRKFATLILADAQAPQLFPHFVLLVCPRSADSQTFAAGLACENAPE